LLPNGFRLRVTFFEKSAATPRCAVRTPLKSYGTAATTGPPSTRSSPTHRSRGSTCAVEGWAEALPSTLREPGGVACGLRRLGQQGCTGWAWEEVLPSFIRLEDDLDYGDRPYHGRGGPIPIGRTPAER
jgi:hypothetical protein